MDQCSGIGRANVSRLENPSLETILRYAQAVGAADLCLAIQPKPKKPAA